VLYFQGFFYSKERLKERKKKDTEELIGRTQSNTVPLNQEIQA